jgi:phosphohistidine phosphatase SixA
VSGPRPLPTAREFLGGLFGAAAVAGLAGALAGQQAPDRPAAPQEEGETTDLLRFPRAFVLVRHAEKSAAPANDPQLSEAGAARAERLAQMLRHSGVTHLLATEFVRTQATLAPLAAAVQRPVTTVAARDGKGLLSALDSLPRGALAVVAGHSNTVPTLVERLSGGRAKPTIDESEYDKLFLVIQWGPGTGMQHALELRF